MPSLACPRSWHADVNYSFACTYLESYQRAQPWMCVCVQCLQSNLPLIWARPISGQCGGHVTEFNCVSSQHVHCAVGECVCCVLDQCLRSAANIEVAARTHAPLFEREIVIPRPSRPAGMSAYALGRSCITARSHTTSQWLHPSSLHYDAPPDDGVKTEECCYV